ITSRLNSSSDSQMCSCVFLPAWLSRMTWSMWEVSNLASFLRMVSGEPISPPRKAASWASGFAVSGGAVEAQRELEERRAVRALPRLLVGLGAHEEADERDVGIDDVVGEL